MDNDPFIDDFPMKTSICSGFSMATIYQYHLEATGVQVLTWMIQGQSTQFQQQRNSVVTTRWGPPEVSLNKTY